ncbi:hypothetical protein FO519_002943 [Halicephalobus sp. NKZ332]|nr:hypothetical protein FO519_002943 [Halicephalobus sp. NKZ332]
MHAFTGNSAIDGVNAFRTKSLLNKRGSSCFTIGAIIARLQDFVDGNDEPTVWIVVNHNLIQRCVFVMCEGRYHVFKPTDRYVRWIPQCPREYLLIEEVVPFSTKDGESHAAVVLPTEEQLQLGIKQRDEFRQMVGLPIIEEGYQPILSPNMEYEMASPLHESSMSLDSTSGNMMGRLHVEDLPASNGIVEVPKDTRIEGLNSGFCSINVFKLFMILDKICPVFLTIGWLCYFFESYDPFFWAPRGTYISFNFVEEEKDLISCENETLTGFGTPSLLRMSALKSFPNIFFRASILPLLFGRLFFLSILLSKWRMRKGDETSDFVEPLTMALATVELISVATFAATSSPLDSLYRVLSQLIQDCKNESWSDAAAHLYDHLSKRCPLLYGADDPQPWEYEFDEEKMNRELLGPIASMYLLEPVIPENPEDGVSLQRLVEQIGMQNTNRKPGQICGRMFKSGDPTYTCKECALDETCVLCHDCFHKSAHAKHKYRMHSSYGGGYCDCGDPEAWSKDFACQMHTVERQPGDDELNFDTDVPEDMKKRISKVTAILLKYAVTLICWQGNDNLPKFLSECQLPDSWHKYKTMLFNDETHTYDAVISALETATGCTSQQAMFLATIVDREGRSVVLSNTMRICSQAKEQIQHRTRRDVNRRTEKSGPLEVKIMTHGLIAHQTFAVKILQWLTTQAQQYSVVASIIAEVLMNECAALCEFEELEASIPPPKPPRSSSSSDDKSKSEAPVREIGNNQFERLMDIGEEAQLIVRAPNGNDADIVINPLLFLNEGLIRQRHLSTNQSPQIRPPKLEKKFIKSVNNSLPCGHLTTAAQLSLSDRRLWKSARSSFHQLLMCTVLMDLEYKMKFGVFIIKNYEFIYQDYIDDDHEYDVSILSLNVQVFTVSSVAAYLIEKENALAIIFETLRHHCQQYLKLVEHNERDVTYLLQAAPINWNDGMIGSFISGFEMYIGFVINMQGMDAIKRQCDQHQLIEAEWETGFNIFVMMQEATTLFINWAKSNPYVHQRIMKIVMDNIHTVSMCMPEFQNLSNVQIDEFSSEVVVFSVGKDYISIHQPIWRLAAGLLLADSSILKFYEFGNKEKREGQMHNYTAPLCRQEMFDRDFQLMQICAATMNSNEFLVRFLDRFNLNKWASKNFDGLPLKASIEGTPSTPSSTPEELSRIVVSLAEEFLHYLIAILGERYSPGVGRCLREDSLKRDIIHLLCTGPKTFSSIEKAIIIESPMKSIKREEILNVVADFSRPNSTSAGIFKLKDDFREEYNAFYIRYSRNQLSQAEQTQWKEREKASPDVQACPPPRPIEFQEFFAPITKIFESTLLMRILSLILTRFEKHSRYSSDGLLHRCLFLIGMGLNEQEMMEKKSKVFNFLKNAEEMEIFKMLKNLEGQVKTHRQLLGWVLKRYDHIKSLLEESQEAMDVSEKTTKENKSESSSDLAARRAAIGKARSQKALKMMNKLQKKFVNSNIEFPMEDNSTTGGFTVEEDEYGRLVDPSSFPICLGPNKSSVASPNNPSVTCILCQETDSPSFNGKIMVCSAFVQNSKLFIQEGPTVTRNFQDQMEVFTASHMPIGYSVSTCSHVMHADCFKEFSDNLWNRDRSRQRVQVVGQQIVDQDRHEYLCPLCKRLSNAALPLLPTLDSLVMVHKSSKSRPTNVELFETWLKNLTDASMKLNKNEKNKSGHKTHSRKRSHSERSLMELQRQRDDGNMSSSYSVSQPLNIPLSPASDAGLTEAASISTATLTHDQRGTSEPIEGMGRETPVDEETAILNAAEKAADSSIQHIFLNKLKNIIVSPPKYKDNIPQSLTNLTPIIRNFLGYVSEVGPNVNSMFSKEQTDVFRLFKATAFVLRSTTHVLKSEGKPLFGAFNTRQRDCITCLSRLAAISSLQLKNSAIQISVARGLTPLLIPLKDQKHLFHAHQSGVSDFMSILANTPLRSVFHLDGPDNSPSGSQSKLLDQNSGGNMHAESNLNWNVHKEMNILDCDMLSLAIQLSMTIGFIWADGDFVFYGQKQHDVPLYKVPDGSVDELYAVYLTLLGQIFQTIASFKIPEDLEMNSEKLDEFTDAQREKIKKLMKPLIDIHHGYGYINVDYILSTIKKSIISFLEPLAVFYNAITLVPPPDVLKHPDYNEFGALCRYMGLPTRLEDLLAGDFVEHLFAQWSLHIVPVKDELCKLVRQPIVPRELIQLPHEFTDLLRMCTKYKCPSMKVSGDHHHGNNQPTMCLVCGTMMCSQAYCCQKTLNDESMGACNYHMRICSGENNGIFLRIRESQVLLLSRKRGTYKYAPYVDEFGETDSGFRRGNPLHLQPEIYKKFQRLWNYQEVAEEVVNQYDMNHRNMNFDWHHF